MVGTSAMRSAPSRQGAMTRRKAGIVRVTRSRSVIDDFFGCGSEGYQSDAGRATAQLQLTQLAGSGPRDAGQVRGIALGGQYGHFSRNCRLMSEVSARQ
jgi:hypothetical protein